MSIADIKDTATKLAKKLQKTDKPLSLIIIDYVQLIRDIEDTQRNRTKSQYSILKLLKELAVELNIPIVISSQLSKGKNNEKPILSDFKDSGATKEIADIIVFVHRRGYYSMEPDEKNNAELIVAKNKYYVEGTIQLMFEPECMKFYNKALLVDEEK